MKTAKEMFKLAESVKTNLVNATRDKALQELRNRIGPEILKAANAGNFECTLKILNPEPIIIELEKLGYIVKNLDGSIYEISFRGIMQKDSDYHWSDKGSIPAKDLLSK